MQPRDQETYHYLKKACQRLYHKSSLNYALILLESQEKFQIKLHNIVCVFQCQGRVDGQEPTAGKGTSVMMRQSGRECTIRHCVHVNWRRDLEILFCSFLLRIAEMFSLCLLYIKRNVYI